MNTYAKFAALIAIVVGTLLWLAVAGAGEAKAYYKTIGEVQAMGDEATAKRLRVIGDVEEGSIRHIGKEVHFTILRDNKKLDVIYKGQEPLPDTFRNGSEALADGRMQSDGTFHATRIQAKCASKYEAKPGADKFKRPVHESPAKTDS